jgi:hypothetical protein
MPKRPEEALAEMIAAFKQKTGKSMDEWLEIVRETGLAKHGEIVLHLKATHDMTHGYANQVALAALRGASPSQAGDEDPIQAMVIGPKAGLKPIFDAVIRAVQAFGADVDLAPKKGYVSVRRNKQFAIVQPSTATRLDVGINLKGVAPLGRLEASGSFNAMLSHRVRLENLGQVYAELIGWLKQAYEGA